MHIKKKFAAEALAYFQRPAVNLLDISWNSTNACRRFDRDYMFTVVHWKCFLKIRLFCPSFYDVSPLLLDERKKENKILFWPAGCRPRGLLDKDKLHPRQ